MPTAYSNNEVSLRVRTEQYAWVVLNDVYFPWWRADVAGQPAAIRRANGLFRAVCVPPGDLILRFSFRPFLALLSNR